MITQDAIRELAAYRGAPAVTTVYLDVDGRHRPVRADYQAAFERLADQLRRRARSGDDTGLHRAVDDDIARMRDELASDLDRSGTRGIAMFSCSDQGFFEAMRLPCPVRDQAALASAPHVSQLLALRTRCERVLVALVDRERVRLLRLEMGEVDELTPVTDARPRAVDTSIELGSFEHHREEAVRIHFRRAAEHLQRALQEWPADQIIVGGPDEAVAGLESYLPAGVTAKIIGRVHVWVSASAREIADLALDIAETAERERQIAAVELLRQRATEGRGGVAGLEATLTALTDKKVATLFVSEGFAAPGARCPACGHLSVDVRQCPVCGTTNEESADIVEAAIDEAIAQRATVEFCRNSELDRFGSIGAIERY